MTWRRIGAVECGLAEHLRIPVHGARLCRFKLTAALVVKRFERQSVAVIRQGRADGGIVIRDLDAFTRLCLALMGGAEECVTCGKGEFLVGATVFPNIRYIFFYIANRMRA
ncbi:MAG: hypothetical protein HGB15_05140 [Chlorobaculum sp.]|jgi:hypothetical protein|nr:hypothetical protein [Chlorobaculum sp.]